MFLMQGQQQSETTEGESEHLFVASKVLNIRKQLQSSLIDPKQALVSVTNFKLSAKDAEVYTLVILELDGINPINSIPTEYLDLYEVFNEKLSNELLDHEISHMKIEF